VVGNGGNQSERCSGVAGRQEKAKERAMNTDKQSATPQVGWLCSCVPEEIVLAAVLNPTRLSAEREAIGTADAYIYHNLCPYVIGVKVSNL